MKSYTDLEQSKKLAEFLSHESADMEYIRLRKTDELIGSVPFVKDELEVENSAYDAVYETIPCWSLTALLKHLSKIKSQVYTPVLFSSEDKWVLQFVEYGHGNVCEVTCDNPVNACYEMIIKLHELKML